MNPLRTLVLSLVVAVAAFVAPAVASGTPAPAAASATQQTTRQTPRPSVVRILGAVQDHDRLTVADLQALPQQSVTTTYSAAGVPTTSTFTGPLLVDVIDASDPTFDPAVKNDSLAFAVLAHATDGYRAVVSWGEIDPAFENKQVLVAVTQDGVALDRPRLVVPGDAKGGRYVSDLNYLRLVDLGG